MRNEMAKYRKQLGFTQQDVADKLGVTRQYISNIERGVTIPSLKYAMGIVDLLEKKVEEVFFLE